MAKKKIVEEEESSGPVESLDGAPVFYTDELEVCYPEGVDILMRLAVMPVRGVLGKVRVVYLSYDEPNHRWRVCPIGNIPYKMLRDLLGEHRSDIERFLGSEDDPYWGPSWKGMKRRRR